MGRFLIRNSKGGGTEPAAAGWGGGAGQLEGCACAVTLHVGRGGEGGGPQSDLSISEIKLLPGSFRKEYCRTAHEKLHLAEFLSLLKMLVATSRA